MTEDALVRRLEERRRQTARIAYGTFALACLFLIGWVHAALDTPLSLSRIMLAVDFLPFCVLFFLIAFYNALINFQIRSGRRATWREYLLTDRGFLPQ
jgi:Mn2+/Fe2+ NRAMP family transporter